MEITKGRKCEFLIRSSLAYSQEKILRWPLNVVKLTMTDGIDYVHLSPEPHKAIGTGVAERSRQSCSKICPLEDVSSGCELH